MQVPTTVSVESRDNFTTDPFFLAARQTLEKCLMELTAKHREMQLAVGASAHCCCCCCDPASKFGNWPLAAVIPCLLCCPNVQTQVPLVPPQPPTESPACLLPGQLSLNSNNFELLLNIQGFQPHEIRVNVKDDYIEVYAEQQPVYQQPLQSTVKRYRLPCPVNADLVQCSLSKDGILLLTAPWK